MMMFVVVAVAAVAGEAPVYSRLALSGGYIFRPCASCHFMPRTDVRTAQHAWEKSCYFNIDYKIDEGSTVYDAISRMSAYNVGCLIVTKNGVVSGRCCTHKSIQSDPMQRRGSTSKLDVYYHLLPNGVSLFSRHKRGNATCTWGVE